MFWLNNIFKKCIKHFIILKDLHSSRATNLDEDKKIIKDPKKANRGIYKTFCNYFCVPNNKLKDTHSDKKIKN